MDGYSRLVAWLKVLLPLVALGLLSTLFLISGNAGQQAQIPFAQKDIEDRLSSRQVTQPFFSGTTSNGDRIHIAAEKMTTEGGQIGENRIEAVSAQFDLLGGTRVSLLSDFGRFSMRDQTADLTGNVVFTTSDGYRLSTDRLDAMIAELHVHAPGPVVGDGPLGTLNAGSMLLEQREGQESPHLLFTGGVKMVYEPGG